MSADVLDAPSGVRTVIIDDTADLRALLNIALEAHGFDVVGQAEDGRQGIDLVRESQPELVMLDLAMPVMDGLEALPAIRDLCPEARIVVLSGFGAEQMCDRALRAGADGYIQKGASIRSMVDYLRRLTAGQQTPTAVGPDSGTTPPESAESGPIAAREPGDAAQRAVTALDQAPFGVLELVGTTTLTVRAANQAARDLLRNPLDEGTSLRDASAALDSSVAAHLFGADPRFSVRLHDADFRVWLRRDPQAIYLYLVPGSEDAGLLRRAIASTAHELRGPVAVIGGVAEMMDDLGDSIDPPQREKLMDSVARQARILDTLTADLLTAAQVKGGTLQVHLEDVDPTAIVAASVADRPEATVSATDGIRVRADPLRLHQMVDNLLSNAQKYGRAPYEVAIEPEGDHWVRIAVHDRGDGVPSEFADLLFQEFSRAPGTDAAGTGMGLFVVRNLARAQHGTVDYAPRPGGGSTFAITLPRFRRGQVS